MAVSNVFCEKDGGFSTYGLERQVNFPSHQYTLEYHSISSDRDSAQPAGTVQTPQGRCIAYTNMYQHKLSPISLTDPTKLGHIKMLTLHLGNPQTQPRPLIMTTSDVPPQQMAWVHRDVNEAAAQRGCRLGTLPQEILDMIVDALCEDEDSMGEREAQEWWEKMREARAMVVERFFPME